MGCDETYGDRGLKSPLSIGYARCAESGPSTFLYRHYKSSGPFGIDHVVRVPSSLDISTFLPEDIFSSDSILQNLTVYPWLEFGNIKFRRLEIIDGPLGRRLHHVIPGDSEILTIDKDYLSSFEEFIYKVHLLVWQGGEND